MNPEKRGLTGFQLKLIALSSMLLDHFAAVFLSSLVKASYAVTPDMAGSAAPRDALLVWVFRHRSGPWQVYNLLRLVGRLAFPIYCFLMVQGFLHTRSVKKYALRLGLFALISEVPFDLAFGGAPFVRHSSNVFFTLLIGLLVIWGVSATEKRFCSPAHGESDRLPVRLGLAAAAVAMLGCGMYLAEKVFGSDYGAAGVAAVFVLYLLRRWPVLGYILSVLTLTALTSVSRELFALLAVPALIFYRGRRGKSMKYFFYVFYPAHLLILVGLCRLLGI